MKNWPLLFFGIFAILAVSWLGLVLTAQIQYGSLQPTTQELDEETGGTVDGDPLYPLFPLGLAQQGELVYNSLNCASCHTQQVRRPGLGSDYQRGYGLRGSVPRDYIRQNQIFLGDLRVGPDLTDVGQRHKEADWYYRYLYTPSSAVKGSLKPSYQFLFEEADEDTLNDIGYPPPTAKAKALVAYLLNLRLDYDLPEAKQIDPEDFKAQLKEANHSSGAH